jgi:hypothetical protein
MPTNDNNNLLVTQEGQQSNKEVGIREERVLPAEAEEISDADLMIYTKWIDTLLPLLNRSCGYGPVFEKDEDLRTKLLTHLIDHRADWGQLDSVTADQNNEKPDPDDNSPHDRSGEISQVIREKILKMEEIDHLAKDDGIRSWVQPVTIHSTIGHIRTVLGAMQEIKDQRKKANEQQSMENDKLEFFELLETSEIPKIGCLKDHLVLNGRGVVERLTKDLMTRHGKKTTKSWWEEYRGLEIDF